MFYGKKSFRLFLMAGGLLFLVYGFPRLAALFNPAIPHLPIDKVVNERYLPPYDIRDLPSGDYTREVSVYGPVFPNYFWISRQHHGLYGDQKVPAPLETIIAKPDDTVTLPDGEQVRILALEFMPQVIPESRNVDALGVYYHPTGQVMTLPEIKELAAKVNIRMVDKDTVWNSTSSSGCPFTFRSYFQTDVTRADFDVLGIYDSVTGGFIGGRVGSRNEHRPKGDDPLDRVQVLSQRYLGISPNKLDVHLRIWQGEETLLEFTPDDLPFTFAYGDKEYTARNIQFQDATQLSLYKGDEQAQNHSTISLSPNSFKLVFDGNMPFGFRSLQVLSHSDEEIKRHIWTGSEFGYAGKPEDIKTIRLRFKPDYAHVVYQLNESPVLLEENRQITDLLDATIPSTVIKNEYQWNWLIETILQSGWYENRMAVVTPLSYPLKLEGKTVREVLEMDNARFRDSELAIIKTGDFFKVRRDQPGAAFAEAHPSLDKLYQGISGSYLPVLFIAAGIFLIRLFRFLQARTIRSDLAARGWTNLSVWDAEELLERLGKKAWTIPSYQDLAVIPDLDISNMEKLAEWMERENR